MALVELLGKEVSRKKEKVDVSSLQEEGKVRASDSKTCPYRIPCTIPKLAGGVRAAVASAVILSFRHGQVLGLYFSAHWCPPCRGFTPKLAEWYNNFKKGPNGSKLEIVFVSSDRDESSFDEYYGEMPWLALPFPQRDVKVRTHTPLGSPMEPWALSWSCVPSRHREEDCRGSS